MVKFSKQFEGQLVPEWKDAFVDYWQLKKDVKKMQVPRDSMVNMNKQSSPTFSHRFFTPLKKVPFFGSHRHKEQEVIQVHRKLASSASKGDVYETELLDQFTDTDAAKEFFARLDLQLNKVNQFYKRKEQEFMDRGDCLKKQMAILLELKLELKRQQKQELTENGTKTEPLLSCTIICQDESNKGIQIDNDNSQEITSCERNDEKLEDSEKMNKSGKSLEKEGGKLRSLSSKRFSHQGKNLMINIPLTTPSRTFSALSDSIWGDIVNPSKRYNQEGGRSKVNVNKSKLHRAEKMIRGAYVELFKGLGYLQTYRNLNLLAFVKILKKFDKVTGKQVLSIYLKVVESSYFNSSDKAIKLMDEVEELFVKHFAEDDKRKAMKYLKPQKREESHAVTFFIGLFLGCFVALLVGYCIMAHITGMYTQHSDNIYMETVYPVLSMFTLLFLHLFLYGCNIFLWRKTRINYNFIFEFSPTKALKYRDVFLICTTSMAIVVGVLFAHLSLTAKGYTSTHVQAIPGLLLLLFVVVLICPLDIVYKSSRYHFLEILRNIFLSPLYKVVMVDFFMADQLCSQVPTLRSLEYVACYYITGSFKTQNYGFCSNTSYYRNFAYAVSFLPYYWRAMQCARRWFDEGDTNHLINLGKYVSAMLAAGSKVAYEKEKSIGWLSLVVAMSSVATVYQLYWDFVKDWGLLQPNSKNPWLRNELILRRKFIYFLSMGLNFVLRLAWLQTVLHYNFGSLDYRVTSFFLAALEVIRRGHWNFYRLENEHLNNAGKFRAVKTVPLPFHEVDQD